MEILGKKFVALGGAGFIGSHTVDLLLRQGAAEILIFDNFSRGTLENISGALADPRVKMYQAGGDILHTDFLNAALTDTDGVFHFAALWLLQCIEFPRSAFEVNIRGTFNVMEACIARKVRRLIYSSSASVYGDAVEEPMDEGHPFNNRNFYGATKIAGEAMLRAYAQQYGLDYVGLRYMNVYGPRQDYRGVYVSVIMKILEALESGESPVIVGDGTEAFDFVSVLDCAYANICAMQADTTDRFYNVGTGVKTTLNELAALLMEITGIEKPIRYVPRTDDSIVRHRVGSPHRARKEIGFSSQIALRDGLVELVRCRAQHKAKYPAK